MTVLDLIIALSHPSINPDAELRIDKGYLYEIDSFANLVHLKTGTKELTPFQEDYQFGMSRTLDVLSEKYNGSLNENVLFKVLADHYQKEAKQLKEELISTECKLLETYKELQKYKKENQNDKNNNP